MKRATKTDALLAFIARHKKGVRFVEVQAEICRINGLVYDRSMRGYWCTNLFGAAYANRVGVFERYCVRTADRRYRLNAAGKKRLKVAAAYAVEALAKAAEQDWHPDESIAEDSKA